MLRVSGLGIYFSIVIFAAFSLAAGENYVTEVPIQVAVLFFII